MMLSCLQLREWHLKEVLIGCSTHFILWSKSRLYVRQGSFRQASSKVWITSSGLSPMTMKYDTEKRKDLLDQPWVWSVLSHLCPWHNNLSPSCFPSSTWFLIKHAGAGSSSIAFWSFKGREHKEFSFGAAGRHIRLCACLMEHLSGLMTLWFPLSLSLSLVFLLSCGQMRSYSHLLTALSLQSTGPWMRTVEGGGGSWWMAVTPAGSASYQSRCNWFSLCWFGSWRRPECSSLGT